MEQASVSKEQPTTGAQKATPNLRGTVLELMATLEAAPDLRSPGAPPPTPPVEMNTTTRSGEGYAQIADDSMTDHMYE